ncbi:hypothetical protein OG552_10935 [Streptomyces sp. NBC_01476]|uniref:hypothetical protein n=1 Tax=Streptomyces sp. NBC_01476 TaxID=2903881 RepID=UPI002E311AC3|nr:hypothetical protein [Streptomyces sp. NBC_01476]
MVGDQHLAGCAGQRQLLVPQVERPDLGVDPLPAGPQEVAEPAPGSHVSRYGGAACGACPRRYQGRPAVHPGAVPTNLQQHTGGIKTPPERRKTAAQGAATSVLAAASPLLDGIGGRYPEDCAEAEPLTEHPPLFQGGVAPFALDPANAERLWETALRLTA